MKLRNLNIISIAVSNLKARAFRSTCLISLAAVLSFSLLSGSLLSSSLKGGMDSMRQRLGADIMVVPEGNKTDIEGALLRGEPGTFYFKKQQVEGIISDVEGVSKASSQLFLASLSKGCCSFPVQLIGFDPTTDFVIAPWVSDQFIDELKDGQLVIGSLIDAQEGGALEFFGQKYQVAGKLSETGMGFDTSVFINYHTAEAVLNSAKQLGISFKADGDDLISAVMIKVEDGYDPADLGKKITGQLDQEGIEADVVLPQNILSATTKSINNFILYVRVFSVMLWILTCALLMVVFTFSIHERKKEIAVLRILGTTRKKLLQMIFCEAVIISAGGSLAGILLTYLVIFPFNTYISMKLGLPYILPQPEKVAAITIISFLLTSMIGPVASAYSAYRIGRNDIHITMREGE